MHVSDVRPEPVYELRTTATATTITIAWMISSTIFVDRFEVTYNYTVHNCAHQSSASVTTRERMYTLEHLNEDSTYTITVRAVNDVGSSSAVSTVDNTMTARRKTMNLA